MANEEMLTDDYVAGLLAKDAKETTIKYSALGMEAFAKSKPPANKPKPNTRFLRNIIKETDNHNAALLAKEAAESQAHLNLLTRNKKTDRTGGRLGRGDIRSRQLGDIAAILGGGPAKRRKVDNTQRERRRNTSSPEQELERAEKDKIRSRRHWDERDDGNRSSRSHRHRERSVSRERRKDRERRKKERSSSRSPNEPRTTQSRHRNRSPKRNRSRSADREKSSRSHRRQRSRSEEISSKHASQKPNGIVESKPDYDSDPLDEIIGPRPPKEQEVRSRGRGTLSGASGMDSRFSASYDPKVDVQPDLDDGDDWEQALEAIRDRQKWIEKGADRLRAAGFTEDELKKWQKGAKAEEDVKWAKKGEGREWDRGKAIGDDGNITFNAGYGRLKDE